VVHQRVLYPSLEHAFVAALAGAGPVADELRAKLAGDQPLAASQLHRQCAPAQHVQASERIELMRACVRDKMMRHAHIKQLLLDTEEAVIVHADDSVDEFWGVKAGAGANHLGKLLMAVRAEIAAGKQLSAWMGSTCKPFPADAAPRVTVTVTRKGELVESRQLDSQRPFFTVGKFESSDFVLAHPTSSRKHALLAFDRDSPTGLVLIDLGSKAGSSVDRVAVSALVPTAVPSGAELVFGLGSSRTYAVSIDQTHVIYALEAKRRKLGASIASMERDLTDEKSLLNSLLAPALKIDPSRKSVFIANLPFEAEEEDVKDLLEAYGAVRRVHFPLDKETNKPRGICFVDFEEAPCAHAACALNGEDFLGRTLRVELAALSQASR
jgi:predicted NAD-dependent protein-ADP-ribosyltransferase YbiA (DUF1768 family)